MTWICFENDDVPHIHCGRRMITYRRDEYGRWVLGAPGVTLSTSSYTMTFADFVRVHGRIYSLIPIRCASGVLGPELFETEITPAAIERAERRGPRGEAWIISPAHKPKKGS